MLRQSKQEYTLPENQCWPHLGLIVMIENEKEVILGTAFIVEDNYALTCLHMIGTEAVFFKQNNSLYPCVVIRKFSEHDIAVLELNNFNIRIPSIPIGDLPNRLPIAYITYGHRVAPITFLKGFGMIHSLLEKNMLQLETKTQKPGMSGCPIAIESEGRFKVVGIGYAVHNPKDERMLEDLAFAYQLPFRSFPKELFDMFKNVLLHKDNKQIEEIIKIVQGVSSNKYLKTLKWLRNISLISCILSLLVYKFTHSNIIPVQQWISGSALLLVFSLLGIAYLNKENYKGNTLIAFLRNGNTDIPPSHDLFDHLNNFKNN